MEETVYVYPKVKVREQEDQEDFKGPPLNDDSSFPAKENEEISLAYVAKIPKSYVPNVPMSTTSVSESLIMPTISASEGAGEIDKKIDEDDKINVRASSILRPRAVLSSPDNDVMIGNKNRVKAKRPSCLKNHNLVQSRHTQGRIISSDITECTVHTRKSKDADDSKSDLRGKKGSTIAVPSQKRYLRTNKPSSVKT
ncbi:hypothetical protein CMV_021920 [Castanea mollissima]|uniref:Uncharacterized protein n=1 Tax=Castanea mollissima TaxID=60419 RepID=A0A8J4QKE8_9ROSI|nr:hypothetical protein CMV_021920 [Castanea mollissima]